MKVFWGMVSFVCGCWFSSTLATSKPGEFMFAWSIAMIVVNTVAVLLWLARKDD
jgi:hypothetical protein